MPNASIGMRFNTIVDFVSDPCDAPFHIYIQTALPILGRAVLTLITPDFGEVLQNYVEPRGYSSCFRNRRNERGRRNGSIFPNTGRAWRPSIPDTDSLIASMLPGRRFFEGRNIGGAERFAWRVFNVTELIGYKLLLLDLTTDGIYAWHSALLETEWCQATSLQVAKITNTDWVQGYSAAYQTIPQNGEKSARNGASADLAGIVIRRFNWRLVAYWKLTGEAPGTNSGTFQLIGPSREVLSEQSFNLAEGETQFGNFTGTMNRQGQVNMQVKMDSGAVRVSDTNLWGQQNGITVSG